MDIKSFEKKVYISIESIRGSIIDNPDYHFDHFHPMYNNSIYIFKKAEDWTSSELIDLEKKDKEVSYELNYYNNKFVKKEFGIYKYDTVSVSEVFIKSVDVLLVEEDLNFDIKSKVEFLESKKYVEIKDEFLNRKGKHIFKRKKDCMKVIKLSKKDVTEDYSIKFINY